MRKISLFFCMFYACLCFAGSSNALLECKEINKKESFKIKGSIPGDEASFELEIVNKTGSIKFISDPGNQTKNKDYATIAVVESLEDTIWTLSMTTIDGERNIKIYAIPSSLHFSNVNGGYESTFKAKIITEFSGQDRKVETVICSLHYSI